MNKTELQLEISLLKHKLAELSTELSKLKNNKVFIPEEKDEYYYINGSGSTIRSLFNNSCILNIHRKSIGNCYRTEEEAEKDLAKQQALTRVTRKLRELEGDWVANWSDISQSKFFIFYTHSSAIFYIFSWTVTQSAFNSLYSTEEACQWVIDNMEDDLKLIFEVEG